MKYLPQIMTAIVIVTIIYFITREDKKTDNNKISFVPNRVKVY